MAIGSIINLGGGGGSISGAKGVIICDTSTMTVGDTIRVRDVYDSQNVQNKQVVTVGTPVIFEVDWGCYYKICTVQTIDDTPTEIGGIYKSVDYGQTIYVDMLNKNSLQGIQGILNSHTENYVLNIGDEVTIKVNIGGVPTDWVMLIGRIDGSNHLIDFVSKLATSDTVIGYNGTKGYSDSPAFTYMSNFYSNIDQRDRQFIKQKTVYSGGGNGANTLNVANAYVWLPTAFEVLGASGYGVPTVEKSGNNEQLPIFISQANRIRSTTVGGSGVNWWEASRSQNQNDYVTNINGNGEGGHYYYSNSLSLLPCFRLTADS